MHSCYSLTEEHGTARPPRATESRYASIKDIQDWLTENNIRIRHNLITRKREMTPLCSQAKLLDADKSTAVATDAHTASAPQPKVDAQRCQSQGGKIGSAMSEYLPLGGGREGANRKLFNLIQQMQQSGQIRFTQLIWEGDGRWIHISYVPSDLRCQVIDA